MSSNTIIVIAIVVAVFLAFLMVTTTSRRRDTERATGRLSRETIQKDRSEESAAEVLVGAGERRTTGREIERLARTDLQRATALPATTTEALPAMLPPMDPETLGVTRRQFLNRGVVASFGLGLAGFGVAVLAFLWPKLSGGFGSNSRTNSLGVRLVEGMHLPYHLAEVRVCSLHPQADRFE